MGDPKGDEMTGATEKSDAVAVYGDDAVEAADRVVTDLASADAELRASVVDGWLSQADLLEHAIQAFLSEAGSGVVSVSRVVNPLLQLWSVARDVDAVVAVPLENLLTALVGRSITTAKELTETMTEVRLLLAGMRPLAAV